MLGVKRGSLHFILTSFVLMTTAKLSDLIKILYCNKHPREVRVSDGKCCDLSRSSKYSTVVVVASVTSNSSFRLKRRQSRNLRECKKIISYYEIVGVYRTNISKWLEKLEEKKSHSLQIVQALSRRFYTLVTPQRINNIKWMSKTLTLQILLPQAQNEVSENYFPPNRTWSSLNGDCELK